MPLRIMPRRSIRAMLTAQVPASVRVMALAIAATPAVLATAVPGLLPGAASAQSASAQSADRPLSRTVLDFEGRGYLVRSVEDDGRTHDVEAITPDGRRIEALVDAATGEVLSERADD